MAGRHSRGGKVGLIGGGSRNSVPVSLLRVQLRPRRRHQIRVHLAHMGHPVLGDDTYSSSKGRLGQNAPRMFLHASALVLRGCAGKGKKAPIELCYESASGFENLVQEPRTG